MTSGRRVFPEPRVTIESLFEAGQLPHIVQPATWADSADARGLVISTPMVLDPEGNSATFAGNGLDQARLRTWTLFWDHLDLPTNNFLANSEESSVRLLRVEGILKQTKVVLRELSPASAFVDANTLALKAQLARSPGRWSLALGPGAMELPKMSLDPGAGLMLTLHNAIPIPDAEVRLEAVLEFKERRKAERLALRADMDAAYQLIVNSSDPDHALAAAVDRIERAIANQIRVSREAKFPFRLSSLKINFKALQVAGAAGAMAYSGGASLANAMAVAGVAGATEIFGNIEITSALKGAKAGADPFGYINDYRQELPVLASW